MSTFLVNMFKFPSNNRRVHPLRTNSSPAVIFRHDPSKDFPKSANYRPPTPEPPPYCSVCYQNITKMRPKFGNRCQCKLLFCKQCIMRWVVTNHNTCPTCREQIFENGTTERIKHIHNIYSHNKVTPTETSINNLVQFFENIESKNKKSSRLNKLTKLCRTLFPNSSAPVSELRVTNSRVTQQIPRRRHPTIQQILNDARARVANQPNRMHDNRTSVTDIVLIGSMPISYTGITDPTIRQ